MPHTRPQPRGSRRLDYHTPMILALACEQCTALPGERCQDAGHHPHRLRRLSADRELVHRARVVERDLG